MGLKDLFDPYASPHARQQGMVAFLAIIGVIAVIAIVGFVILNPGGNSTPSTPAVVAPTETPFATLNPDATPVKTAAPTDTSAPDRVTDLTASEIEDDSIKWTWSDPTDADLKYIMVYIDDIFKKNVSPGTEYYKASGLDEDTEYTISVRPIDKSGNLGSFRDHSATTGDTDSYPGPVTSIGYTAGTNYIYWYWTDPTDADFDKVQIMVDDIAKGYIDEGVGYYNATSVSSGSHTIKIRTIDDGGNSVSWSDASSHTATTSTSSTPTTTATTDTTGPGAVTNLVATEIGPNYITIEWTNPSDTDLAWVKIYSNDVYIEDEPAGTPGETEDYDLTGLTQNTPYEIMIITVDQTGNTGGSAQITRTTTSA